MQVTVHKAQRIRQSPVPDLNLVATDEFPHLDGDAGVDQHDRDARAVVHALTSSLPGGTLDRVLGHLMQDRASLLRVPSPAPAAPPKPVDWPPAAGTVWQDRHGDRWVAAGDRGYLFRLNVPADDNADEIWRTHGPLTFVDRLHLTATDGDCPF